MPPNDDLTRQKDSQTYSAVKSLVAGGLAGMVAKTIVAPLDRIKILFQVTSSEFRLRNLPTVIKTIIEEEGVAMLWKGNVATMVRVFPYAGVQFMVGRTIITTNLD